MFPFSQRLHSSEEIIRVLRQGRRSRCGYVTCYYLPNAHGVFRVTVIVDKKISKRATVRNLWKRRARAILKQATLPKGDCILRLYSPVECSDYSTLKNQIISCLSRLPLT